MNPSSSRVRSCNLSSRLALRRSVAWGGAIAGGLSLAAACGGKDDLDPATLGLSAAGSAGADAVGVAGAAGAGSAPDPVGAAGSSAANGGAAGAGPSGGNVIADGTITVLNDDADALKGPTTAALRNRDLWVVNGQIAQIGGSPILPFDVVSVPLEGGPVDDVRIELAAENFFPEGIAVSEDGTLFVGSVTLGTIVRIRANETVPDRVDFVPIGVALRGVVGLTADDERDALWFCDSSPGVPGGDIVGVDLGNGLDFARHPMPDPVVDDADAGVVVDAGDAGAPPAPSTFCNDLIVLPNGDILATDSSGRVFRVEAPDAEDDIDAQVWLESPAITVPGGLGANGIDLVGDRLIIASSGTLVSVDPNSAEPASTVRVLSLAEDGALATLCGPDGLQAVPGSPNELVVVENGSCDLQRERVVKVTLNLD
jgi:hypothetical protein